MLAAGAPVGHPLTAVVVSGKPQDALRNGIDPVTRNVGKNYLACDKEHYKLRAIAEKLPGYSGAKSAKLGHQCLVDPLGESTGTGDIQNLFDALGLGSLCRSG